MSRKLKAQTAAAAPPMRIFFFLFHDKSSQQKAAQTQQLQAGKAERSRLNPHILGFSELCRQI